MMDTRGSRTRGGVWLAALAITGALAVAAMARPARFTLPPETSTLTQRDDPGYALCAAQCSICHSRDYITTQPPRKGKEFWTAEVNKMVTVYGAPIAEPDRVRIAAYLAATY